MIASMVRLRRALGRAVGDKNDVFGLQVNVGDLRRKHVLQVQRYFLRYRSGVLRINLALFIAAVGFAPSAMAMACSTVMLAILHEHAARSFDIPDDVHHACPDTTTVSPGKTSTLLFADSAASFDMRYCGRLLRDDHGA